jgi:class 3 adenylate cyclase
MLTLSGVGGAAWTCATCDTTNVRDAFCVNCGAARAEPCPRCGCSNGLASRFCGSCGTRLDIAPAPATQQDSASGSAARGGFERRRATVLFCDVVGLSLLAASLDPEELNDIIQRYYEIFARTNARFNGCVASLSTDGTLAIFGYPSAHEDDAERAVRAAQGLLNERLLLMRDTRLQMRIGIATGVVGVGAPLLGADSPEISVVGEAPNLAARLQSVAEPDTILLASSTSRLLGDLFELEPTASMTLKGFDDPVIAWRVRRPAES